MTISRITHEPKPVSFRELGRQGSLGFGWAEESLFRDEHRIQFFNSSESEVLLRSTKHTKQPNCDLKTEKRLSERLNVASTSSMGLALFVFETHFGSRSDPTREAKKLPTSRCRTTGLRSPSQPNDTPVTVLHTGGTASRSCWREDRIDAVRQWNGEC